MKNQMKYIKKKKIKAKIMNFKIMNKEEKKV